MIKTPLLTVDCVVFDCEKAVLTIKRRFSPFEGWNALPGGFVDLGETTEQACARELFEETGQIVRPSELKLIGVYSKPDRDLRRQTVSIAYLALIDLENLVAGDDAADVELLHDWKNEKLAFDHKEIIIDGWKLSNSVGRKF
jgi:8-oxo-dGTP diphosphatase